MEIKRDFLTKEEIDNIVDIWVNHPEVMEEELRKKESEKMQMVKYFYRLNPDRCGKVNFENNTVTYDEKHYKKSWTTYRIEELEDYIRICDTVGLDYEIRTADHIKFKELFSICIPDNDEEETKDSIAVHLHMLYQDYYRDLLKEYGIDVSDTNKYGYEYYIPWSGCEKRIAPERFSDKSPLLTDAQIRQVMKSLYPKACERATKSKPIFKLEFETGMTESGEKRICKAKLDKEHLLSCRRNGFNVEGINIDADEFDIPARKETEQGRDVYYLEFVMRHYH